MKRILFAIIAVLTCFVVKATDLKVINGNINVFKGNSIAVVEYDYSGCHWEEEEDFKTWCGDEYNNRINVISNAFMHSFNENSKGLKLTQTTQMLLLSFCLN